MIDFSKIRTYKGTQSGGFEELVCQLGRRELPESSLCFQRVEGAGGDGGVEAYWKKQDGSKIGYQAKYFLKSGDIDWSQIDKSVKTALEIHPTLSRYVIAIACNLTDKTGKNGKSGWEHWETHKTKWEGWATEKGLAVVFDLWSASEILDKLTQNNAQGLKRFWFDTAEFSNEWYQQHINVAVKSLGERYHQEDHVDVAAQAIGHSIVRHPHFIKELYDLRSKILKIPSAPDLGNDDDVKELKKHLEELEQQAKSLGSLDFNISCKVDSLFGEINHIVENIRNQVELVKRWYWKKQQSYKEKKINADSLDYFYRKLGDFREKLENFCNFIESKEFLSDQTKFVLITGEAGIGKSHLSGFLATSALAEQRPVFLFNGFDFKFGTSPINEISDRVCKGLAWDEVFGAINTAGEAARVRALIIIDAINEGAGSQYWRNELPAFITTLNRYPYIACILTCRKEYEEYATEEIEGKITKHPIHGFSTPEEQEAAARIYLDKRGISRPATPWLNPEFINPLFLRTATTALKREGKTEFPKGLTGTSAIFAYFVEATAKNMRRLYPDLSGGLKGCILHILQNIVKEMLTQKQDRISWGQAVKIVNRSFEGYSPPEGISWLDIFIRNGLLQRWPVYQSNPDPLQPPEDVVGFSFQRFQDHVMATQLLEAVTDPVSAFKEDGAAAFCLIDGWRWGGLISALSIIIPEKYEKELIDCLPEEQQQQLDYSLVEAFKESVKWRKKNAFTERTRKFLNWLQPEELISLVLEMSICEEHPFNVENLLHPKLMSLDMPHRDARWSTILAGSDSEHPIYRIIDWSLDGSLHVSSGKTHELAALVLAWSFSTTDRNIRDRATKSLVALIENNSAIFPWLVDKFKAVDDLYILERIYAAAYGAVCRNCDAEWIPSFAETAFKHLFSLGKSPLHLLLRDYARGLVEIAKIQNCLPKGIDEQLAYPPYHSSPPRFNLKEEAIKKIANKAGGNQILSSCTVHIGDFANYEIPHATNDFLTVPLKKEVPLTTKEKYNNFKQEVIEPNKEYKEVFDLLEAAQQCLSMPRLVFLESEEEEAQNTIKKREEEILPIIQAAQKDLFASLSKNEKVRYNKEVKPYFKKSTKDNQPTSFDLAQRRLWVAKRAYAYGWNEKLFGKDITGYRYGRERPTVERIGKKYQWLALSELQCRLADNYWLKDYDNPPQKYDSPLNIGYERDIDPTITRPEKVEQAKNSAVVKPIMGAEIDLGECEDKDIDQWPFLVNSGDQLDSLVYRTEPEGKKFSVLYEHRCTTENFSNDDEYRGYRRQEFRFISAIIVLKNDRERVINTLKQETISNFDHWGSIDFTDGPFLLEHPWHSAWHYPKWEKVFWDEKDSPSIARTVNRYLWESHLDKALPEGFKVYMPCPWLCKELELRRADETSTTYVDTTGSISAICGQTPEDGSFIAIETKLFEQYLKNNDYECLWIFLAERNAFKHGGMLGGGSHLRVEGVAWKQGHNIVKEVWKK